MAKLKQTERRELAEGFKLLSAPTRLEILTALASGPKLCRALCDESHLSDQTVLHHLGLMRAARLVEGSRKGLASEYAANGEALRRLGEAVKRLMPK